MERLDTTCVHCIHVFDLNNLNSKFKRVFCLYRTQGGVHFHVCKQYITLNGSAIAHTQEKEAR